MKSSIATLAALQRARTVYDTRHVIVFDIPIPVAEAGDRRVIDFNDQVTARVARLPGVAGVAVGSFTPWRDAGGPVDFEFSVDGYKPADGEPDPH